MTREEFRIKFSQAACENDFPLGNEGCELSERGLNWLTDMAEAVAEPLFEKIEYLSNEITNDSMTLALQESIWFEKVEKLNEKIEKLTNLLDDREDQDVRLFLQGSNIK